MKLILSPAKKMRIKDDCPFALQTPRFQNKHDELFSTLASMDPAALQKTYGCSDRTFAPVWEELCRQKQGIVPAATPALAAYEGIAFQYMAPDVFTDAQWDYVNTHLRILSAMYGLLKPLDGIVPYRLEMAQKLPFSLYDFWGSSLADALEEDVIINLASKEYADAIRPYKPLIDVRFFEEEADGSRKEKGVYAKMARGSMVRFLAEHQIEEPEGLKGFDDMGYRYDPDTSCDDCYVFVRPAQGKTSSARPKKKRPVGGRNALAD